VTRELEVAIAAARAGGDVLRAGLDQRELDVVEKGSRTSLVTSVDLGSQEAIVGVIREAFPGHAVVGEEGTIGDPDAGSVWVVDPLDGTTNYAHGFPFYCVSVALRTRETVSLGVVLDPARDDLFVARRGQGATHNGTTMQVSGVAELRRSLLSTQVQSDDPAQLDRYAQHARLIVGAARAHRALGAPALALAYVARGWLDCFCEPRMSPWDTLAGSLLVEEAGGRVTTFAGEPRPLEPSSDVLASNGLLHDDLIRLLGEPEPRA
jgi:myo-inositol-1(or 4)-monophosphatase